MIKIKSDKIIVGETLFDGYMDVLNGKIAEISKVDKPCKESYDYMGKYVSAGFIDMQCRRGLLGFSQGSKGLFAAFKGASCRCTYP